MEPAGILQLARGMLEPQVEQLFARLLEAQSQFLISKVDQVFNLQCPGPLSSRIYT